jgi:hypothetical protein
VVFLGVLGDDFHSPCVCEQWKLEDAPVTLILCSDNILPHSGLEWSDFNPTKGKPNLRSIDFKYLSISFT